MKVFKYEIFPNDYVELFLPKDAQILSVQTQNDTPCLWALVDPNAPKEIRRFRFAGTGHPIDENKGQLLFVGTFQMRGGFLVFHLFEIIN